MEGCEVAGGPGVRPARLPFGRLSLWFLGVVVVVALFLLVYHLHERWASGTISLPGVVFSFFFNHSARCVRLAIPHAYVCCGVAAKARRLSGLLSGLPYPDCSPTRACIPVFRPSAVLFRFSLRESTVQVLRPTIALQKIIIAFPQEIYALSAYPCSIAVGASPHPRRKHNIHDDPSISCAQRMEKKERKNRALAGKKRSHPELNQGLQNQNLAS